MTGTLDNIRVLVVDDDPALLDALAEALHLRFDAIAVTTCENAADALEHVQVEDYDAIISDIKMPGMDGLELLAKVREIAAEIPTLLVTGHGQTDLAIQALRVGAFDLIQKPLDRDYLVAALKRAVETRRLRAELRRKQEALEDYAQTLEERVFERTEELQKALKAKDEFLGLVSHELRTPVTVILGNAEILYARGHHLTEEDKATAMLDLRQEARRLMRIIENLLVLARVEYGARMKSEPALLQRTIRRQVDWHKQFLKNRVITLELPATMPAVTCDETQVELVISNLLSNADKYSRQDTPIEVYAEVQGGEIVVSVLDEGTGIRNEEVEHLFEPFYRSEETAHVQGMGIGLTVCRRLLEAQGGRIWASPRPTGGSRFSFSLPIATAPDHGHDNGSYSPAVIRAPRKTGSLQNAL
jgi:K+-sensing histidine kinase KdpD